MTYEIELKIKLSQREKTRIEEYLSGIASQGGYLGGFEQTDYYLDTNPPSFARMDTALRIRLEKSIDSSSNDQSLIEITYKGKKLNPNSKTRLEYNLNLVPQTDFKSVEGLFNELGFIKSINIFKKRLNYELEPGIILSLDTNELGDFVEIEKIVENKDIIEETEEFLWNYLQKIFGPLAKDRKIVKSYLELILESRMKQ